MEDNKFQDASIYANDRSKNRFNDFSKDFSKDSLNTMNQSSSVHLRNKNKFKVLEDNREDFDTYKDKVLTV